MCTLVILFRPGHRWPLLIAGNRDEMRDRPSSPPDHHWPEQPEIIAGLDHLGGGTWLGMNPAGVVAVVMNREGTLGPAAGKKSRGELVLKALQFSTAEEAAEGLTSLSATDYRAFNLFIGDSEHCFWIRNQDSAYSRSFEHFSISPGLHMLASRELDDTSHPRIHTWLPRFKEADIPVPEAHDWDGWRALLTARLDPEKNEPHAAMNMDLPIGFGTVSSTLIALPRKTSDEQPIWLFADGAPDLTEFTPVKLNS